METSQKKSVNNGLSGILRVCTLLIIFIFTSLQRIQAQADVGNLKHSLSSIKEEQEKIAHEEFMSYVYMSLGFAVVIAIAWGTTIMARKRSRREQEEKHRFILKQQELKKHHGHGLHKARR